MRRNNRQLKIYSKHLGRNLNHSIALRSFLNVLFYCKLNLKALLIIMRVHNQASCVDFKGVFHSYDEDSTGTSVVVQSHLLLPLRVSVSWYTCDRLLSYQGYLIARYAHEFC